MWLLGLSKLMLRPRFRAEKGKKWTVTLLTILNILEFSSLQFISE